MINEVVNDYHDCWMELSHSEVASKWPTYLRQAPNGSLTGLAVPINYGLADISIGSNEFLEYRVMAPNGITYLQPTFHNKWEQLSKRLRYMHTGNWNTWIFHRLLIFLKQPSAGSARDIYLVAFSATVWILIGLTWLLVSSSLKISLCILRKLCRSRLLYNEDADMENEAWIWTLGAMCQKGIIRQLREKVCHYADFQLTLIGCSLMLFRLAYYTVSKFLPDNFLHWPRQWIIALHSILRFSCIHPVRRSDSNSQARGLGDLWFRLV